MKLLIGYDGSPFADAAIDDLQRAGLPADAHALVLSVADVWPAMPPLYRESLTPGPTETSLAVVDAARQMSDRAHAEAATMAEAARRRVAALFPGWTVEAQAVSDSPASAITERAEAWGADLIAIGSHGRGALARMFFGSISQKVLRYAHCSVRVGRHVGNRKPGPPRIVLGLDTSEGAAAALDAVAARPWPSETRVHIVTAVDVRLATSIPMIEAPAGDTSPPGTYLATDESGWLKDVQKRAAEALSAAGLYVTTFLNDGDPKHVLLHEAETWHADLIVVGAKGLSRIERFLLGSVSSSIAARAHCSVEVVRFE
jgi:nucleotide-binding universal stress UspA family protein